MGRDQAPIRLLIFVNSPGVPGGVEEHVLSLVKGFPVDRFEVTLVCPVSCYEMFRELAGAGRQVHALDLYRPSHFSAMVRLYGIMKTRRIEIAHSHQFYATLFLAPIARAAGVRWVVETTHVREAWRQGWIKRSFLIDRLVYLLVDRFIAVSKANADYIVREKRCRPARVIQIYNGRDLSRFAAEKGDAQSVRAAHGIGPSDPLLLHVGRLAPQKGHALLLEVLVAVRQQVPTTRLLLVGDGELRAEIERLVSEHGLQGAVRLAGHQADVVPFLRAADLVVLPSFFEGLPLVAIEAAAAGRAVVGTAVDGTPEVVLDGVNGTLVPPGDSGRLAKALVELLRDPELRAAMGREGRRIAAERFDVEKQVETTARLYEELIWGERRPKPLRSRGLAS